MAGFDVFGPKGTGLPPITGGWDVKANRKL